MGAEEAKRAHGIFTRALELPAAERDAFILASCAGDPAMESRVRRLLAATERSSGFLESPALPPAAAHRSHMPDAIGTYLVVGVLGVGGMATVYEAIQESPSRRVALKVMHHSMTQTDALLRFRLETQTLARLHHPGIAQIYEAGTAQLGQPTPSPFFAMELIPQAVPITAYAANRSLSLRERVAMFEAVCEAVQHGHQHGVIHRDIKPGNVLVDGEGRPKVIDFGVARTTDRGEGAITATSDARRIIGTLNYMSPEQCGAGAGIDIRTDVYSLGVLLYELVCGRLPHDLSERSLPASLHAIVNEPPRHPTIPGARATSDLEAIILKAIEKDPDRRYDSASALASDLRRWLNHQPTEARPPGVVKQFRLFTRRNPGVVTAAASLVASILLIATISTIFAFRLNHEAKQRKNAEAQMLVERDDARWQAYTAQIAGALAAMNTGEFQQMRTRLATANDTRRGWEWGFLQRLSERSERMVLAHADLIVDLAANDAWTRLATAGNDGTISIWNLADLTPQSTLRLDEGARPLSISFLPDGVTLAVGDDTGLVQTLDTDGLRPPARIASLHASVRTIIPISDDRLGIATSDGAARIINLETSAEHILPADQPGGIQGLRLAPDGSALATFNDQGHLWIRNPADFSVTQRLFFAGSMHQVRFSSDGRLVAAAGSLGSVIVWNVADGSLLHEFPVTGGVNTVRSIAFSNDSTMLAAGLIHRGLVLCSIADGRVIAEIGGHTEAVSGIRFSPDDQFIITSSWDRSVRAWRTADALSPTGGVALKGHTSHVLDIAFAPDGSLAASVSRDGTLRLWDPDLCGQIARLSANDIELRALAFSPDGARIATAGSDRVVRLWNATTGEQEMELTGHAAGVTSVAFDPLGTRIAAGAQNGTILIWDAATGETLRVLKGHASRVNSLRFSPDSASLASASRDRTVRLWDTTTGMERFVLRDHESDVFAVLFSKDGRRLFSGSRDQSVRVWDPATGAHLRALTGHGQYVTSLALNHDQTRLAVGSWFGEIVLFDVHSLDLVASFRAHESAIRGVAFSPDGRWLASASYDGTIRLHDSATRESAEAARQSAAAAQAQAAAGLAPILSDPASTPSQILTNARAARLDPARDPWIRKAILSSLNARRSRSRRPRTPRRENLAPSWRGSTRPPASSSAAAPAEAPHAGA